MTGLGDLAVQQLAGQISIYSASGMGGGVGLRGGDTLQWRDSAVYSTPQGLSAPRELQVIEIDGTQTLLASGQYGDQIDAWQIQGDGTLGSASPLRLSGPNADANRGGIIQLEQFQMDGEHIFVTASRYADGLVVWSRDGDTLRQIGQAESADFLAGGSVQAMALSDPGGVPFVLAASSNRDELLAFQIHPNGSLGHPVRLDLRDGLNIDTPTQIETVQLAGKNFAILGSAQSNSVSVVKISAGGQMEVSHQVNDTIETRFDNLIRLEVLQTSEGVFVLAGGTDNGLTLMLLDASGRLLHLASMGDELREMALLDTGGTEMIWRDGGLDIFVTGEVLKGDNDAGRGLTHLRVADLEGNLPQIQTGNADHLLTGTAGRDVFMVADTNIAQVIRGYDKAADQLDLSQMGRFHDISEVEVSRTSTGAVFRLGEAQVTVFTDDGSPLHTRDLTTEDVRDLWHIDIAPPAPAVGVPQSLVGGGGTRSSGRSGRG